MKISNRQKYLQPSELCDFDRSPEIRIKAAELSKGGKTARQKFQRLYSLVKEMPYGIEDWDMVASETLAKGWGMCAGKTNLLVALLRSLGIPARYRVYRINAEVNLWATVTVERDLSKRMGSVPSEQDHVDCEVWLGKWLACDLARDTPLELGMTALGIPLKREVIPDASGHVHYTILSNFDDWARQRQSRRMVRQDRAEIFARVNEQLSRIRALGERKRERSDIRKTR